MAQLDCPLCGKKHFRASDCPKWGESRVEAVGEGPPALKFIIKVQPDPVVGTPDVPAHEDADEKRRRLNRERQRRWYEKHCASKAKAAKKSP